MPVFQVIRKIGLRPRAALSVRAGDRWARECRVLRLEPVGTLTERPGAMSQASHTAAPLPSSATTRRPIPAGLPKLVLGRLRRKR